MNDPVTAPAFGNVIEGPVVIDVTPVPCPRCSTEWTTIWHALGFCPSVAAPEDRLLKLELELSVIKNELREARARLGFIDLDV